MTQVEEIYEDFLSKISDYSFLPNRLTDEEMAEVLFAYLKTARTKFYRCKNSLEIVEDELGVKSFTVELHPFEIEVLITLMLVEYMKPLMISSETIKQNLSDKDFKIYSQANQLRELRLLYNALKSESVKMITEYTYLGLEDEKLWLKTIKD